MLCWKFQSADIGRIAGARVNACYRGRDKVKAGDWTCSTGRKEYQGIAKSRRPIIEVD
jgi:hypothetical protein